MKGKEIKNDLGVERVQQNTKHSTTTNKKKRKKHIKDRIVCNGKKRNQEKSRSFRGRNSVQECMKSKRKERKTRQKIGEESYEGKGKKRKDKKEKSKAKKEEDRMKLGDKKKEKTKT